MNAEKSVKPFSCLVVNCQVLFAILKCVMYKLMPYLLFYSLLVAAAAAAACAVLLCSHQGALLFVLFFTGLLCDEVICIAKSGSQPRGSVGNSGGYGLTYIM